MTALCACFLQSRSQYDLRMPVDVAWAKILTRGDRITVYSVAGEHRNAICRDKIIRTHNYSTEYSNFELDVTPSQWRHLWWSDMMGRLGISVYDDERVYEW